MTTPISVAVNSKYHRDQFDDWLAGGSVEYRGKFYYWSAQDSGYGFGWEIDPVTEEDWSNIGEPECEQIAGFIVKCLAMHKTEYAGHLR